MKITLMILVLLLLPPALVFCQHPNIRVSNDAANQPEEVSIAINPTNPQNLVAGSNLTYYYHSSDGGYTWLQGTLYSGLFGVWGDPCLIFDAAGAAYFGHLSNPPSPGYWIDRIVVQKSTNGGSFWNQGVGIGFRAPQNQDKEWLAADITRSPYRNNLYVAWTEFDSYGSAAPSDSSRILSSRSTDGGNSWSVPVRVSDVAGNCLDGDSTVEGAVPAVGPEGQIYVAWSGPLGIMFDRSTDGGVTFGEDVYITSQPGGWDYAVSGIYRANGQPITACDISYSPYRGNVYVQWTDQRNGPGNTDAFFIKSTNGGTTWGPVVKVNTDSSGRQQFFSWMTVDQTTGNIYIVFYDRRKTSGDATDVYVAKSTDGGDTFTDFEVSDSSFTPTSGIFFGDYTNIAAWQGNVYPIWMRLNAGKLFVLTAILHDTPVVGRPMLPGWNLISVPFKMKDYRRHVLFPNASSSAFRFETGYSIAETLENSAGYWIKYPADEVSYLSGDSIKSDTIPLVQNWNMIGTISSPVPVHSIGSNPPEMVLSQFFRYGEGGYHPVDTLQPGYGYWVKTDLPGELFLSSSGGNPARWISIRPDEDLPPGPPEFVSRQMMPREFSLEQNYPNPFNPSTVIRYQLPDAAHVSIKIFDILGREVRTLIEVGQEAGFKSVPFDATALTGGIYFYRLIASRPDGTSYSETKRMVLIK